MEGRALLETLVGEGRIADLIVLGEVVEGLGVTDENHCGRHVDCRVSDAQCEVCADGQLEG